MSQDIISQSVRQAVDAALQDNNVAFYDIAEEENMFNILVVIGGYFDRDKITDAVTAVFCDDNTAKINTATNEASNMTTCVVSYEAGLVFTNKTEPKLVATLNKVIQ